jgi:hypothetical protein
LDDSDYSSRSIPDIALKVYPNIADNAVG